MRIMKTRGDRIFDFFNYFFMVLMAIAMIYPFLFITNLSMSTQGGAIEGGFFLIPNGFSWDGYRQVLNSRYIWIAYQNTVFVTVLGTLMNIFFTSITAYPLSKKYIPGRNFFTAMIVFTMFFSGGMIPGYLLVKELGLMDSRMALILPRLISAFNVIIMRNFFQNISKDLEEAAKVEGAGTFLIFFKIVVPLSTPVIATVSLWCAVGHWNDFFSCLIFIQDRKKIVLQLLLREIVMQTRFEDFLRDEGKYVPPPKETVKAATVVLATIPILIVYPFLQKYFVKGVMLGSLKG